MLSSKLPGDFIVRKSGLLLCLPSLTFHLNLAKLQGRIRINNPEDLPSLGWNSNLFRSAEDMS